MIKERSKVFQLYEKCKECPYLDYTHHNCLPVCTKADGCPLAVPQKTIFGYIFSVLVLLSGFAVMFYAGRS